MAKKKQPATTTPVPTQPDPEATGGRPAAVHLDLDFTPRCPVCYGNARVKLTKTGGYFLQCGSCWLTLFTKSNHGHVTFRAQQDLLADEQFRAWVAPAAQEGFEHFMERMLKGPEG
jgi:hypothetical protein